MKYVKLVEATLAAQNNPEVRPNDEMARYENMDKEAQYNFNSISKNITDDIIEDMIVKELIKHIKEYHEDFSLGQIDQKREPYLIDSAKKHVHAFLNNQKVNSNINPQPKTFVDCISNIVHDYMSSLYWAKIV